jgi:hypothetical protein
MRKLRLVGALVVVSVAAMAVWAPSANATYGPGAEYQIAFSQNCNNAALCIGGQGGLGGTWGWAVLNSNGTGDLELTGCDHSPGQGGGAIHLSMDITSWSVDPTSGHFLVNGRVSPIPAAPGHYNLHPAAGVAIEITVTKLPNS